MLAIPLDMTSEDRPDPACVSVPTGPNTFSQGVEYGSRLVGFAFFSSVVCVMSTKRSAHIRRKHWRVFVSTGAAGLCQRPDRTKLFQLRRRIWVSAIRWPRIALLVYLLDIVDDNA